MRKSLLVLTLSASLALGAVAPAYNVLAEESEESTELVEETEENEEEAEEGEESEEAAEEAAEEAEEAEDSVEDAEKAEAPAEGEEELEPITKKQLREANGKDGNPAYIAAFGIVYDMTDVEAWAEGEHNGLVAGTDVTEALLNEAPHELTILDELEVVGRYVDWELTTEQLAEFGPENENTPNLVAVQGKVYDVTDVEAWAGGEHNGVQAGTDATVAILEESPHGLDALKDVPVVGHHVDYEFDAEELAQFNGQDGQYAYVAVDGVVYDMTSIGAWEGGEHNGVQAGTDASAAFANESPHTEELLETLPRVGFLK